MTRNKSGVPPEKKDEEADSQDLRYARESKGLSLEDIFRKTRISVNNLKAIEDRDFGLLPPPVYSRTFIRQYAKILSVDEKKIMSQYEKYLETLKTPLPLTEETKKPGRIAGVNYGTFVSLISVVIAASIILFLSLHRTSEVDIPHNPLTPQKPLTPVVPAAAPPAQENTVTAIPKAAETPPAPNAAPPAETKSLTEPQQLAVAVGHPPGAVAGPPYRIIIEARELTWLRIRSNQAPPFQAILKPGEKMEREVGTPFTLDLGNAGGVDVRFQGKPLGSLGASGQVVHLNLP